MFQEQQFNANGVIINFVQASVTGQPVLLLHGAGSEWESFLPIISALAGEYRVYALDLRGHGKSSRVPGSYAILDYTQDVRRFLQEQIAEPAAVYGHSLGAQIAIALAAQAPGLVRLLILGDPPFYFHNLKTRDSVWSGLFKELHQVISTLYSAQEMDDYMAEHYPTMDPVRRKARAETMSHIDPGVVAAILDDRHVAGYDSDALLRQITCPVLLLRGNPALGSALREEDEAYMLERIRRCEVVSMPDVGHGLPSGESLSRLKTFLKSA